MREQKPSERDKIVNALLRATARVFKRDLGIDLRLAGSMVSEDQATTEDLSVFVRFAGRFEGCVFFGLNRGVAREILAIVFRRPSAGIDDRALRVLNRIVERIVGHARDELAARGFNVNITSASIVQPAGTRITTRGAPHVVAVLQSKRGPVVVHIVLRDVPQPGALAA